MLGPLAQPSTRRRTPGVLAGAALGVAMLVGGGLFAVRSLSSAPSPNTPEQAVQALLDAVSRSDVLGGLETLLPAERAIVLDEGLPLIEETKKQGYLDDKLDLNRIGGVTITFKDVRLATEATGNPDVQYVRFTSGTMIVTTDPAAAPLGPKARNSEQHGSTAETTLSQENDIFAVRRIGEHWYVSAQDTAFANALLDPDTNTRKPLSLADAVAPHGASTPEGVIDSYLQAAIDRDPTRMIALLPPDELVSVQQNAGQYLAQTKKFLDELNIRIEITEPLTYAMEPATNGTRVWVTGGSLKFTGPDIDDEPIAVEFNGGCPRFQLEGGVDPNAASLLCRNLLKMTMVERDGKWFWSPLRTAAHTSLDLIKKRGESEESADEIDELLTGVLLGASLGLAGANDTCCDGS